MEINKVVTSVLGNKCPACLKGNFFIYQNPYNLKTFTDMNKSCTNCGMDFIQEPGFYFGAAIISYILQALILFLTFIILQVVIELPVWHFIGCVAGILILALPITFRTSRLGWINLMGNFPKKV